MTFVAVGSVVRPATRALEAVCAAVVETRRRTRRLPNCGIEVGDLLNDGVGLGHPARRAKPL